MKIIGPKGSILGGIQQASMRQSRSKTVNTAAGTEWLQLTLTGQTVTVQLAPVSTNDRASAAQLEQTAMSCLRRGCVVT